MKKTEKRQVENEGLLEFGYGYNSKGELSNLTYPGNLQVIRQYDAYGNLSKVLAGGQTAWELSESSGTAYATLRGGTITSTETRNAQGLLTNLKTKAGSNVVHDMDFVFNGATGNLVSRTGMFAQAESFEYDNADRLAAVKHGNTSVMSMGYKPNGNIDIKTGIGQYGYGSRPHAVTSVDNTNGLIPLGAQQIDYTAFNKVSHIGERVGADSLELDFTYGPDRQRWKTVLKKNGNTSKTTIFAGDYEAITEDGQTRQLYYIGAADGVAAIYVKQAGQADKIYYPHTDHLGSIVKLTDGSGAEVFEASYDAWGNRTVSNNTFVFHRGYTGHEHLAEFRLIDMNGRMYDPLLGRFLSPDPFVQMPGFSQNYNRYSYCLNNPLRFTDPSGELFFIIPSIGYSPNGGLYFSLTFGVGFYGSASASVSLSASTKGDFGFSAGVSAAGFNVYGGWSKHSGWNAGAGFSFYSYNGLSSNLFGSGVNYSHRGGWSGNQLGFHVNRHGVTFDPSISYSKPLIWGQQVYAEYANEDNNDNNSSSFIFKNDEELHDFVYRYIEKNEYNIDDITAYRNDIEQKTKDGYYRADDGWLYELNGGTSLKVRGATLLNYSGLKRHSTIYLSRNPNVTQLYNTINHEITHAWIHHKGYTLSMDKSTHKRYHETMAYTVSHGSGGVPDRYNISIFPIVRPPRLIPVSKSPFFQ